MGDNKNDKDIEQRNFIWYIDQTIVSDTVTDHFCNKDISE